MSLNKVKELTQSKPVVIFMKGTPDFPMCGFSAKAVEFLKQAGVKEDDLGSFNVLDDEGVRNAVKEYTKVPTIPQIFMNGEFIGTGDIIAELFESGELSEMVQSVTGHGGHKHVHGEGCSHH